MSINIRARSALLSLILLALSLAGTAQAANGESQITEVAASGKSAVKSDGGSSLPPALVGLDRTAKPAAPTSPVFTTQAGNSLMASVAANGATAFKHFLTPDRARLVVDLVGMRNAVRQQAITLRQPPVKRVLIGQYQQIDPKIARFVFELDGQVNYSVRLSDDQLRVKFDAAAPAASSAQSSPGQSQQAPARSPAPQPLVTPLPRAPAPSITGSAIARTQVAPEPSGPALLAQNKKSDAPPAPAGQSQPQSGIKQTEQKSESTQRGRKSEAEGATGVENSMPAVRIIRPEVTESPVRSSTASESADEPQSGYGSRGFVGDPLSLNLKGIDLRDFVAMLQKEFNVNFIFDRVVPKINVDVYVNEVPWNQVLDGVLKANELGTIIDGSMVRITTLGRIEEEEKQKAKILEARANAEPLKSRIFKLKYARVEGTLQSANASAGSISSSTLGRGASAGGQAGGLRAIISSRLSQRGKVEVDPRTNQVIVTDIERNLNEIEDILAKLDVPEPQVEIETRIVKATKKFTRDLGVALSTAATNPSRGGVFSFTNLPGSQQKTENTLPSASQGSDGTSVRSSTGDAGIIPNLGLPLGTIPGSLAGVPQPTPSLLATAASSILGLTTGIIGTFQITNLLTAAETNGTAKIISSPRITAQNNQTAEVLNGIRIPVQTVTNNTITTIYVPAALRLQITPQISPDGNVLLRLVAEDEAPIFSALVQGIPTITTSRAETTVQVPDGGTTIFGGITVNRDTRDQFSTPGVSRIPFIGNLFKRRAANQTTEEILFFVTPRIYKSDMLGLPDLLPKKESKDQPAPAATTNNNK